MILPALCFSHTALADAQIPWVVYYAGSESVEAFLCYDIIILDSEYPKDIGLLLEDGKTVFGYLSLAELSDKRSYFNEVRQEGLLLNENKNWPGSYAIDIRNRRWKERVIEQLIPELVRRGFRGVFIDTLDNVGDLERRDPARYRGMRDAASDIVASIRANYPYLKVMVNRGYDLIPAIGDKVDFVLGESVFTTYDFKSKKYHNVQTESYNSQVELLHTLQQKFPNLQVLTLDYWDADDPEMVSKIYAVQSQNGFSPYVATIGLDRVVARPVQE